MAPVTKACLEEKEQEFIKIILTFNYPASVAEAYMDEEEKEIIKLKH